MSAMLLGGRYQVQDKIGAGGMATVYRGLDEVLGYVAPLAHLDRLLR